MKTKKPLHDMVFEVVTNDGDVTLLFIFPHGLNTEVNIRYVFKGDTAG